jgi:hypothetical protein
MTSHFPVQLSHQSFMNTHFAPSTIMMWDMARNNFPVLSGVVFCVDLIKNTALNGFSKNWVTQSNFNCLRICHIITSVPECTVWSTRWVLVPVHAESIRMQKFLILYHSTVVELHRQIWVDATWVTKYDKSNIWQNVSWRELWWKPNRLMMHNPRQNSNPMKAPCSSASGLSIHIKRSALYWSLLEYLVTNSLLDHPNNDE